jgi:hypothetical protein
MSDDPELPLFSRNGAAYSRSSDPVTSHQAAESVRGREASEMEGKVLAELQMWPDGLTSHELVWNTGIPWQSLTPRIRPLVRKGLVEDSGIKRSGPSGRSLIVWRAK